MNARQEVYSYSRLNTFDHCRYRYKFQYIDKIPQGPTTIEAFMGSRVHDALEEWYGRRGLGESVGLHELIEAYRESWRSKWCDDVRIVKRNMTVEHYRRTGERGLITYFQTTGRDDPTETLAMELRVHIPLSEDGGPALRGFIDRLARAEDGALEIHDYKTTSRLPSDKDVDADPQLALYQIGVQREFPKAPAIRLIRHFVSFGHTHRTQVDAGRLEQLRESTKERIRVIQACTEYPANVTVLCRWCSYQDRCEFYQNDA
ncbi:MAG: PD-(D/E)XK nuclease family protein [Acidobacteria bacterium]|nr:PD-(D/E)XK nuclease family protein [Acidobacteriota bacterium]